MPEFTAPGYRDQLAGDPDLDGLDEVTEGNSDLDELRAELNAAVSTTIRLGVEGRTGYSVVYRTDFTARDLDSLRKRSKDRRLSDGVDGIKFSALLLAFTCQAIEHTSHDLPAALGVPVVTFTTREFLELMGTADANSTVRKFYGLEGHVDAAARRLMVEAGWGDEADLADAAE